MRLRIAIAMLGCLLVLVSCENSSVAPAGERGDIHMGQRGELLLATIAVEDGTIQVKAGNLDWNEGDQLAGFDVFLVNIGNTPIAGPLQLVAAATTPSSVEFTNPDGYTGDALPYVEFDEEFGGDRTLRPGETSDPEHLVFDVGDHRAFSMELRIDVASGGTGGTISGVVFDDDDEDGVHDASELGVPFVTVTLRSGAGPADVAAVTGANGEYSFSNLDAGVYFVEADVHAGAVATTANPLVVTLLVEEDGTVASFHQADFGINMPDDGELTRVRFYDFEDGLLPYWGGTATMVNRGGTLELIAYGEPQWRWDIFDDEVVPGVPGQYTRGVLELKCRVENDRYLIVLKGRSLSDIGDYQNGPAVYLRWGEIVIHDGTVIETGYAYTPGDWYRVRIEFDNNLGSRGRYTLSVQNITQGGSMDVVGEFDYQAYNGRLMDITEFAFVAFPPDVASVASMMLDDIIVDVD